MCDETELRIDKTRNDEISEERKTHFIRFTLEIFHKSSFKPNHFVETF